MKKPHPLPLIPTPLGEWGPVSSPLRTRGEGYPTGRGEFTFKSEGKSWDVGLMKSIELTLIISRSDSISENKIPDFSKKSGIWAI